MTLLQSVKIIEEKYNIPVEYVARMVGLTQPWYNMDNLNKYINIVYTDSMQTINLIYEMLQEVPTAIHKQGAISGEGAISRAYADDNNVVQSYQIEIEYGVAYMESYDERRSWYETDDTVWSADEN